jgi:hypothetical protein
MKFNRIIAALLLSLFVISGYSQESGHLTSISAYIAELDRLSAAVDSIRKDPDTARKFIKQMPLQWTVRTGNRTFQIDTGCLRIALFEIRKKNTEDARRSFLASIAVLKAEAQEFQQPKRDVSSYKKTLAEILARREYSKIHGPTLWEIFKKKVNSWIINVLGRIIGISSFSTISKIAIGILVLLGALALAVWVARSFRKNAGPESINLQSVPFAVKPWDSWMAEARAAAEKGCWREAIHLAYWTGVSFLESSGLWRSDPTRTPREYLRLVQPASEYHNPLSALTRQMESVWYGYAEAGPDSFANAIKNLESMGCRSN